jgi:hypothetical protein
MSIRCGNCKDRHETVAEVRTCSAPAAARHRVAPAGPVTEGMYVKGGVVYRVVKAVHGSGHLYAQRLTGDGFEMARGMVHKLSQADRMSIADAKAYGDLYGRCVRCQRDLTKPDSIARGMGDICAGKI